MKRATLIFSATVALQVAILVAIPAKNVLTHKTGTLVLLKTAPVAPYSIISGYYVILNYVISTPTDVSGWQMDNKVKEIVYVILEPDPTDELGSWKAVQVSRDLPTNLAPRQVAIKGHHQGRRIKFGIETYYIPESMRRTLANKISKNIKDVRVAVKVSSSGDSALVGLKIGADTYNY